MLSEWPDKFDDYLLDHMKTIRYEKQADLEERYKKVEKTFNERFPMTWIKSDEFKTAFFDVQTRGLDWWKPTEKAENKDEWFLEKSPGARGCIALTPMQGSIYITQKYLLSSLVSLFVTGADRIVLWVTLAYAREYMIQHYAYAPVTKKHPRELSRYETIIYLLSFHGEFFDTGAGQNSIIVLIRHNVLHMPTPASI